MRLTDSQMSIDTGIAGGSRQVLVLAIRDMEMSLRVTILLGQAKIDDVHLIPTLSNAHQEVVGLNIPVDERLGMNVFNTGDELIGQQQDGLQREFAVAEVE